MDPIQQAIDVVRQHWKEDKLSTSDPGQTYERAKRRAVESQDEKDWLIASSFRYFSKDSPLAFIIILWRPLGAGDTIAKIQIKPLLVHWDVELEEFLLVDITRIE